MLFLVEAASHLPADMSIEERDDLVNRERSAARIERADGRLLHIWRLPGTRANVAIWNVADADALHDALTSLPAWPWMSVTVRPLVAHPIDAA